MAPDSPVGSIGRDPDAFEAFYREHVEAVQRFVARRVDSPQDAADLTADVFVAAIDASSRYRGGTSVAPRAWLFGIARRTVAGHWRSRTRDQRALSRLSGRAHLDDDAIDRIAHRIDSERDARSVLLGLASLPDPQRAVVELVAVDGLTLNDAAAALQITAGNARIRYHRARARLALLRPNEATS